jgi:hypothetical protein
VWLLSVLVPVAVAFVCNAWFSSYPSAYPVLPRVPTPGYAAVLAYTSVHALGLATLPFLLVKPIRGHGIPFLVAVWFLLQGAVLLPLRGQGFSYNGEAFSFGWTFPYLGNLITPWGTLPDTAIGRRPLVLGLYIRSGLTVAGCLGGAALLVRLGCGVRTWLRSGSLGWFTLAHLGLLLVAPKLFDRYLLCLLPGALALATWMPITRPHRVASAAAFLLLGLASFGLAHDWLAWNSARWELGRRALSRGIPITDIEGGFEWDGWHYPGTVAPEGLFPPPRGLMNPFDRMRFPELTGRYALAVSVLPGTRVLDAEPYRLWLTPGRWHFYLIERRLQVQP